MNSSDGICLNRNN